MLSDSKWPTSNYHSPRSIAESNWDIRVDLCVMVSDPKWATSSYHSPRNIAESNWDTRVNLCVMLSDPKWATSSYHSPRSIAESNWDTRVNNLDLRHTTLGLSFHLQQQNTGTLPSESPAHDNRCTMVRAEYSPPIRSSNHISYRGNPQIQHPKQGPPLSLPHNLTVHFTVPPDHRQLRRHLLIDFMCKCSLIT
jgi:hypothetical protein